MKEGGLASGRLVVAASRRDALAAIGVTTVADLLGRAELVRDLPTRSNHRLETNGLVLHLKCEKGRRRGRPAEWEGLLLAESAGVPVPRVACHGVDHRLGAVTATEDLAPARPLDAWLGEADADSGRRHRVARALARAVAGLHDGGRHHRDLYLNHVFVDPAREEPLRAVIDWDRSRWHRRRLGRRVVKDLAALAASSPDRLVSEGERLYFLGRYLRARGQWSRRRARRLARRVAAKEARIRRHVPRTPVGEAARPPRGGRP